MGHQILGQRELDQVRQRMMGSVRRSELLCHVTTAWRARRESNPQPSDPKSDALSIELRARPTVFFTYFQWPVNPERHQQRFTE